MTASETTTPYALLGGESVIRDLVERFYAYMDSWPEAASIRAMHPQDLGSSKDKLFKFLSGWLGGPDLYWQEFGHPRLRMRHFPFAIGSSESELWLMCMRKALDDVVPDSPLKEKLFAALMQTAQHMINRPE